MPFVMLPVDDEEVSLLVEASDDGSKTSNSGAADETEDPVLQFELATRRCPCCLDSMSVMIVTL